MSRRGGFLRASTTLGWMVRALLPVLGGLQMFRLEEDIHGEHRMGVTHLVHRELARETMAVVRERIEIK